MDAGHALPRPLLLRLLLRRPTIDPLRHGFRADIVAGNFCRARRHYHLVSPPRLDVALFGVVLPGVENHSLHVLALALEDAGFTHRTFPFQGFAGMRDMVADVIRVNPRICGLSLQTTEAALATLTFARMLRAKGYSGSIVIGGHLASLAPEDILASDAVDVVVQLAGEQALVGIARGEDPHTLPGTVTARGRGVAPVPVGIRAIQRTRLGEHLGFGAADIIVSRGCPAHCSYCCVASVSTVSENVGAARHIVRDVEAIADELAELAARGGRAFHFMDDNILPLVPNAALEWTRALSAALSARRVPPIAFSMQLRADVMTTELANELAAAGLVRAYVGIDGYTSGQLRALGRHAQASAGVAAVDLLSARGIFCVANSLLIGPTLRFETIVREIEGIAAVRHAPVHLLPIEARPGTVYHQRAAARGLIEGGPLWPSYRFEDPRAFLVGEVITGLPTRLVERSVPIALYDLAWALGVARRLAPAVDISAGIETYARVTETWNADQIRMLRAAVAAAQNGREAVAALLANEQAFVRAHDEALLRACDDALTTVENALSVNARRPVRAHARGRLLGGLAIAMGLAACPPSARVAMDAPADSAIDGGPCDDGLADALPACTDPMRQRECYVPFGNNCDCTQQNVAIQATFNERGEIVDVQGLGGNTLPADVVQCLLALVGDYCYPTHAGKTETINTCHSWIA